MSQHLLNRADVVIRLQEMCGKTVAEGMGGNALRESCPPNRFIKRLLDVCFMEMIPPTLLRILHESQRLLWEKPLIDEILCGFRLFLFELIIKKDARVARCKVSIVKFFYYLKLCC